MHLSRMLETMGLLHRAIFLFLIHGWFNREYADSASKGCNRLIVKKPHIFDKNSTNFYFIIQLIAKCNLLLPTWAIAHD